MNSRIYVATQRKHNGGGFGYQGRFASVKEWAFDCCEQAGLIQSIHVQLRCHIDFKPWARNCEMGDDITVVEERSSVHIFQKIDVSNGLAKFRDL